MAYVLNFSFLVRSAIPVAEKIICRIWGNSRKILQINKPSSKDEVVFRYEGGMVIRLCFFNKAGLLSETGSPERWVLWKVAVCRYPDGSRERFAPEKKISEVYLGEKGICTLMGWDITFLYPHVGGMEIATQSLLRDAQRVAENPYLPLGDREKAKAFLERYNAQD